MRRQAHGWAPGVVLTLLLAPAAAGAACPGGVEAVGRIVAASGSVGVDGVRVDPAALPREVCADSVVATGLQSRARIYLIAADTVLTLDERSTSRIAAPPAPASGFLALLGGGLHFLSQVRRTLSIETPYVSAGVEGTEVLMRVTDAGAELTVFDGDVALAPGTEGIPLAVATPRLATGERLAVDPAGAGTIERRAEADAPHAPLRRAAARELAWTLYYPPIVPDDGTTAPSDTLRAARLLRSGRVDEARSLLARVADDGAQAAERDGLLALIAVIQGDPAQGRDLARAAAERAPTAAAPLLALSYAEQALAELEAAREAARRATVAGSESPPAWARLAETELMFGETARAREASARAVALAPTALAHIVDGFAALAAFDIAAAERSFDLALAQDSEQPLAHLGRGLALIRQSRLEAGREALEVAAGLDPTRSLLRSYLGKAYLEERRDGPAGTQFAIAKELDFADPTPWLYDAIRKQLDNRPVDALGDLERSIALNDNRATFRSRLLLDQDRAVRSTNLAAIYADLGFEQLGQVEATRALAADPASDAAHRLLADLHAARPRHEVARVSERFQGLMLSPLYRAPLQPSQGFADLRILPSLGPARVSFNEFTPLFERDGPQATISGFGGTKSTWGDEAVVSGAYGRAALSLGQFHYQTDGFRPNNHLQHDIYDVFGQVAVTPELSLQAQYRYRDSDEGDLELDFDPDSFSRTGERKITQHTARVGARFQMAPWATTLLSYIYADRDETVFDSDSPALAISDNADEKADDVQLLQILTGERARLVLGAGLANVDQQGVQELRFDQAQVPCGLPFTFPCLQRNPRQGEIEQRNVYTYADIDLTPDLLLTAGLAYDDVAIGGYDTQRVNPKLGLRWDVAPGWQLRGAWISGTKRVLVVDQTLEPTQVAGFNQFYDDFNGTEIDLYGVGVDGRLGRDVFVGAEAVWRDLDVPFRRVDAQTQAPRFILEDWEEQTVRVYLYWAPHPRWALSAEYLFDRFERDKDDPADVGNIPIEVRGHYVPLALRYFDPSGFFAELRGTYIHQDVDRQTGATIRDGSDDVVVVDAAVGYRLPGRRGQVSLEARNLLDSRFNYQDDNFRSSQTRPTRYLPEQTVLLRATLRF